MKRLGGACGRVRGRSYLLWGECDCLINLLSIALALGGSAFAASYTSTKEKQRLCARYLLVFQN